jgi:disulfide bond formation protein DsbB
MTSPSSSTIRPVAPLLNYLYLLLMMCVIAGILTAAMTMQYAYGELPCPLCLLQRVAMFGVCFGTILSFRFGYSERFAGISLLFSLFLLIVSVRQTLLDIYPRPGHEYIGSAVLGLHMPVWSIIIAVMILGAYAVKLVVLDGGEELRDVHIDSYPALSKIATAASLYVILLGLINFGSVVLQCGIGECHTFNYQLLNAL